VDGYELIVGSSIDPQFGPVVLFGSGGQLVEVFKDRALALPPLTTTLARRLMQQTLIYKALQGVRGRSAVALGALEELLVKFSWLVSEQRAVKEVDINPLIVAYDPAAAVPLLALDARVVLHGAEVHERDLPRLAIRPYPSQYRWEWTSRQGVALEVRPIRAEDEPLMVKFHGTLSDRSVYLRYLHPLQFSTRVAHERLARICFNDYDREIALVAERGSGEAHEFVGVGRLAKLSGGNQAAEFAILVSDAFQGQGLGSELLGRLVEVGRQEGLQRIVGYISPENDGMLRVARKLGFVFKRDLGDDLIEAEFKIDDAPRTEE
jgi:acetyltransferase